MNQYVLLLKNSKTAVEQLHAGGHGVLAFSVNELMAIVQQQAEKMERMRIQADINIDIGQSLILAQEEIEQLQQQKDEAWKEYDNLKAEMEALGKAKDAEIERMKNELTIAVKALGHIEHGVLGVEDYCAIATGSLERIKASQETE